MTCLFCCGGVLPVLVRYVSSALSQLCLLVFTPAESFMFSGAVGASTWGKGRENVRARDVSLLTHPNAVSRSPPSRSDATTITATNCRERIKRMYEPHLHHWHRGRLAGSRLQHFRWRGRILLVDDVARCLSQPRAASRCHSAGHLAPDVATDAATSSGRARSTCLSVCLEACELVLVRRLSARAEFRLQSFRPLVGRSVHLHGHARIAWRELSIYERVGFRRPASASPASLTRHEGGPVHCRRGGIRSGEMAGAGEGNELAFRAPQSLGAAGGIGGSNEEVDDEMAALDALIAEAEADLGPPSEPAAAPKPARHEREAPAKPPGMVRAERAEREHAVRPRDEPREEAGPRQDTGIYSQSKPFVRGEARPGFQSLGANVAPSRAKMAQALESEGPVEKFSGLKIRCIRTSTLLLPESTPSSQPRRRPPARQPSLARPQEPPPGERHRRGAPAQRPRAQAPQREVRNRRRLPQPPRAPPLARSHCSSAAAQCCASPPALAFDIPAPQVRRRRGRVGHHRRPRGEVHHQGNLQRPQLRHVVRLRPGWAPLAALRLASLPLVQLVAL